MSGGGALPAWYVAFHDSSISSPWLRLLRPGFRHCFAFAWDDVGGRWIVANLAFDGAFVRALTADEGGALWANLAAMGATVVLARAENAGPKRPRLLGTCNTVVEAMLGLPGPCALSPYRLWAKLVSRGAVPIMGGG